MTTDDRDDERFDPITLEILWSRLISIADEAAAALVRTAFSTIVRECNDYSCVLMDAEGDLISENHGTTPSFSCILPRTTKHFLRRFPRETWRPGDCVVTNDPWLATGHLPDFTLVTPIFHESRLVGFSGSVAHSPDVGGTLWGADTREVFEEGIRILPSMLLREGRRNDELMNVLLSNVRLPEQVAGDLEAQITANEVCARATAEFLADTGLPDLADISRLLQRRSEAQMRRDIEAVPDGVYRAELDADGFDDDPTHIACAVTVAGSEMTIDYEGTSRQIGRAINCVYNYTYAYSAYPVKCLLNPFSARTEGSYRPISVKAPEGSILNPRFPAPVGARQLTGHLLAGVIYRALAPVLPERIIAECGGAPTMRAVFSGRKPSGDRFSQILFASGGMGAAPHRDGLPTIAFPTNVGAGSMEAFESMAPLIVWKKELRTDSGGPGTHRGGLGQVCEVEIRSTEPLQLSLLSDRRHNPAEGVLGGRPGALAEIELDDGRIPHQKSRTVVEPGTRLTLRFAGGGGFGPPDRRDPARVADDLRDGYVSPEGAERDYGIR